MPKIPKYTAQKGLIAPGLTKESPAINIDPNSFTGEARALTQMGVSVSEIAENIQKVKSDQEYAQANITGYKSLQEMEVEASQDNDFQNFESKYSKKIQDTKQSISKNIRSPQAKRQFDNDFELKSTYAFYNIMANGRKRFIEFDQDLMNKEASDAKERYFSATSPQEKQNARDELASIFMRRVQNKTLNRAEGVTLHKKEVEGLTEGQVEWDILNNPFIAAAELQKGKFGIYKDLPQKKRVEYIGKADTRIEKLQNQEEESIAIAMNQREAEHIEMRIARTLTEEIVMADLEAGEISPKFAEAELKNLRNPKISKKTNATTYNTLALNILDKDKSIEENRINLLNNNAIGKLSDEDMEILYVFNQNLTKDILEQGLPKKSFLQKISWWSDEYVEEREEVKAQMFKQYMQRINRGENPADAFLNVLEIHKKKSIYELGQIISTPKGNVKIIGFDADGEPMVEAQ